LKGDALGRVVGTIAPNGAPATVTRLDLFRPRWIYN